MGTGEASGDKRALTAAEAAIANPLIDDSSMKGARGLLISITGGKDLTLFEVDEAATRIREEVDPGCQYHRRRHLRRSLDGVIRVSVVATGIEQALISRNAATPAAATSARGSGRSPDNRLADLTARLRADNQRLAERAQKLEAQPRRGAGGSRRGAAARFQQCRTGRAGGNRGRGRSGTRSRPRRRRCSPRPTATSRFARSRRSRRCSRIMMPCASRPMSRRRPRHSFRRRPNARRCARRGCRNSKICRCRRRTKFARPAAKPRTIIRKRPGCRCCSALPMSASAAATKRASRRSRPAPRVRRWRDAAAAGTEAATFGRAANRGQ